MSDITAALTDAVTDACGRHPSSAGADEGEHWNTALWSALDEIGITLLSVPEERGGSGGDLLTAAAVLQVLGRHAATVPFVETALLAAWLLAECRTPIPTGPMAAAVAGPGFRLEQRADGWVLNGAIDRVPWARHAAHLVVLRDCDVVIIPRDCFDARRGTNLAGEPRDDVIFDHLAVSAEQVRALPEDSRVDARLFAARATVGRLALMAGATQRALELSLGYAAEREQFGRSLTKFQAMQQHIAAMAGEVLLGKVAAESAALALDGEAPWELAIPAARVAAAHAAGTVARIAHQIHGAIGFTEEHDLRRSTTRIWSWRDEIGGVGEWAGQLGALTVAVGPDGLWPLLADGAMPAPGQCASSAE